jgi:hypothetical protein
MADGDLALPQEVVVLVCVLAAAMVVCMGYAIHRTFNPERYVHKNWQTPGPEQHSYMVEVRQRAWA